MKTKRIEEVYQFCSAWRRFLPACSWDGHESLVFPSVVTLEARACNPAEVHFHLVRFYIGLEVPELLIEDLKQAFAVVLATGNQPAAKVKADTEQIV